VLHGVDFVTAKHSTPLLSGQVGAAFSTLLSLCGLSSRALLRAECFAYGGLALLVTLAL
jgi:hypothetical protein